MNTPGTSLSTSSTPKGALAKQDDVERPTDAVFQQQLGGVEAIFG